MENERFILTKEQFIELFGDFEKVENKFKKAPVITLETRKSLVKTGDKSIGFIKEAVNTLTHEKSFLPPVFDIDEFKEAYEAFLNFGEFLKRFNLIQTKLEDIYMMLGDNCYKNASEIYKHLKAANTKGKYKGLIENMANHIPKKPKKAPEPTPETPQTPK